MTIDSHVIVRSNTDIPCMFSPIFSDGITHRFPHFCSESAVLPALTCMCVGSVPFITCVGSCINTVKILESSITERMPHVALLWGTYSPPSIHVNH